MHRRSAWDDPIMSDVPAAPRVPAPPRGLGAAGKRLWSVVVEEFELAEHETGLLVEACRTVDACEALQARLDAADVLDESPHGLRVHPALPELRQQRATLTKLLASLRLPSGLEGQPKARRNRWPNLSGLAV